MNQPSPLASPEPWNLVCEGYVAELSETFSFFADQAIERVGLEPNMHVVDVAAGPGTLTLRAAPNVEHVTAIDFSPVMIEELKRQVREAGLTNVTSHVGDGQALPLPDESCDRVFSMFGLIFFPDRESGFTELYRVLRPGGKAAVSSWVPAERIPPLRAVFETLAELLPEESFGKGPMPLGDAAEFAAEMRAAGFDEVTVHEVHRSEVVASAEAFWASMARSSAPLVLLRGRLGESAWDDLSRRMTQKLSERLGEGALTIDWIALVGVATRAAG